jgi:4-diphosphocytidyl-2-C-methyl-D-erythritol kinase
LDLPVQTDGMILYPNAKINLGLRVIEKRSDGFHNIETLFFPVQLCDVLEFIETDGNSPSLEVTGIQPGGNVADNLVIKAWKIINERYHIPAVKIHLHKIIPAGAGLGGGSSDGASMLKGLDRYFNCGCKQQELSEMAALLGSDCPFFILNSPALGTGRGEILHPISFSMKGYTLLLKKPDIHINTGKAYAEITPCYPKMPLIELISKPVFEWQHLLINDFEHVVFKKHPEIGSIKKRFIELGAEYAAMSGSGSSVFGIFSEGIFSTLMTDDYNDCYVIPLQ